MIEISKVFGRIHMPDLLKQAPGLRKEPRKRLSDMPSLDGQEPGHGKSSVQNFLSALATAGLKHDLFEALQTKPALCLKIFKNLFTLHTDDEIAANLAAVRSEFGVKLRLEPEWEKLIKIAFSAKISGPESSWLIEVGEYLKNHNLAEHELLIQNFLLRHQPEFHWPYFRVGVLLFEMGRAKEALRFIRTSTDLNPDFAWSWFFKAMAETELLGAENALDSLQQAIALADDNAFNLFLYAFISLAKVPWTNSTGEALTRVILQRRFSDEDLCKATLAFSQAADHNPHSIEISSFINALQEDLKDADGRSGSNNWWPIHVITALIAVEQRAPDALKLIARADFALSVAFSRRDAAKYYENYIQKIMKNLCRSLALLPQENWTDKLAEEALELGEMCATAFKDFDLSEQLIESVASNIFTERLEKRVNLIRLQMLSARDACFEMRFLLSKIEKKPYAQNAEILKRRISNELAISRGSGPTLLATIENTLCKCETSKILTAYDVSEIIKNLERDVDIAYGGIYSQYKVRANDGDGRAEGASWASYLRRIAEVIDRIEAQRNRLSRGPHTSLSRRKTVIFTSSYIPQVRHYRAEQMAELLDILDIPYELHDLNMLSSDQARNACADASVVVFQRQPATTFVLSIMAWARSMKIKVVYDIDDLIFDSRLFPPPLSDYAGNIDRATYVHLIFDCPLFQEALNHAEEIIVSTLPLKARVEEVLKSPSPVHLRRNFVGSAIQLAVARNLEKTLSRSKSKTLNIFYGSGTKAHKEFFETTIAPALANILVNHPQARLILLGDFPEISVFERVSAQIVIETPDLIFDDYLDLLASSHINIGPLDIAPATDAKSELKWFEAASLGIPSVVSPTQNYRDVLEDGKHVLFATTQTEWEEAINRLITDGELREELVNQSRLLISELYVPEYWARQLIFDDVLTNRSDTTHDQEKAGRKKRLLVVNTFFWPQSIGGATRVVESYVDELCSNYSDEFEIFVLCANANPPTNANYEKELFWYQGALVIQVNVPARDWADPLDNRIETLCEDIITRFRIDVAHLHSVQILTASVAVALHSRNIPVILSLHDGWWLSEHQFLVDDEGMPFMPDAQMTEIYRSVTQRLSTSERLQRRKILRSIVKTCKQVVAVSDTFAEVYINAGFKAIGVHENGVIPTRLTTTRNRKHGVVRLGFIGGRSDHKGYGLLCRALLEGGLTNIELVVVDHAKPYGYEREGILGDSKVLTVGKFPQDRVGELYTKFDVLAAPSIWPESYGLVAREARFAGIPVLVGNKGDIGRGVEENVDGWVVDVDDPHALRRLLERFNADCSLVDITPTEPNVISVQTAVSQLASRLRQETWPQ